MTEHYGQSQVGVGRKEVPEIGKVARKRWLSNSVSKKGPMVLAWSIGMPNERCPFASAICSKYCYAMTGQFTLHAERYAGNYELTKSPDLVETISTEIIQFVEQHTDKQVAVAVHEKGEFYSLDYVSNWRDIIDATRDLTNLNYFIYTRSWRSPLFRESLEQMAERHRNVRINLSTDSDMLAKYGMPSKIGGGLITYLSESDADIPPHGVDLVFRNLRAPHNGPMEYSGDAVVCPNESDLFIAKNGERPVLQKGNCRRIRCQDCRLCIDRAVTDWPAIKSRYAGTPGQPPNIIQFPVEPNGEQEVA